MITVSTAGFYSLTITDKATGCDSTYYAGSIHPLPDLRLFPIGCAKLCEPDTLHLYIPLPLNELPPYDTYADAYPLIQWFDNGVFAGIGEIFPFPVGTSGYHQFSVKVWNSFWCEDTAGIFCLEEACCFAEADSLFTKILSNTTYSTDVVWDGKYYIDDNVIVTVTNGSILDITNVDVVFGECAGIVFTDGALLRSNNSVYRPCYIDGTWKGLRFVGKGKFDNIINECTFKNAEVALYFQELADGVISSNLFSNCNYGIRVEGNNSFNHPISGNRFVTEQFFPSYNCPYQVQLYQ